MEGGCEGVNKEVEGGAVSQPAGFLEGGDTLDPAFSFFALGSQGHLAPQHGETQSAFGAVVGRLHSVDTQEGPHLEQFLVEPSGEGGGWSGFAEPGVDRLVKALAPLLDPLL